MPRPDPISDPLAIASCGDRPRLALAHPGTASCPSRGTDSTRTPWIPADDTSLGGELRASRCPSSAHCACSTAKARHRSRAAMTRESPERGSRFFVGRVRRLGAARSRAAEVGHLHRRTSLDEPMTRLPAGIRRRAVAWPAFSQVSAPRPAATTRVAWGPVRRARRKRPAVRLQTPSAPGSPSASTGRTAA